MFRFFFCASSAQLQSIHNILYQKCNSNNTRNKSESPMFSEGKNNIIEFRDRKRLWDKIYYLKNTTGKAEDISNLSELCCTKGKF